MAVRSTRDLKQVLFNAYGGFADKRIKTLDKGALFIVDDRTPSDDDAAASCSCGFARSSPK